MLLLGRSFRPWLLPGFLDQWDYRSGVSTDGSGNVNSWTSRRDRVVSQTGAARPLLTGSGVSFNGASSQYLELSNATILSFLGGVPLSMFVVGNSNRASVQCLVSCRHNDAAIATKRYWENDMSTTVMRMSAVNSSNTSVLAGITNSSSAATILYGHRSSSEIAVSANGSPFTGNAVQSGTWGIYTDFSALRFGVSFSGAAAFLTGSIQEFIIYNRIISDLERNAVFKYLGKKYGIQIV